MDHARPTRQERRQELQDMMRTREGEAEVERLFHACFAAGRMPPPFSRYIETILDHEYGSETTE